jgi:phosphoglycolate phosphatase
MTAAQELRACLIDLDGTLLDTAPDLALAANRVRGEFTLPPLEVTRIAEFIGKGTDMLVHRALTDDVHGQAPAEDFVRGKASFERHYREVNGSHSRVFAGVPEALSLLRQAGLLVGCVTNKPREFTRALLERMGLLRELDVVIAGDDVARRKPHPDLVLAACSRLHVGPSQVILIGDSANDALAARAAGCPVLCVSYGYNEGVDVHNLDCDAIVGSLSEAANILKSIRS